MDLQQGQGKTRRGRPRRTATIALNARTRENLEPYAVLPWWACCHVKRFGKLTWGTKAVLSVVLGRLMSLKGAAEQQDGCGADADDVMGTIANWGDETRFEFSQKWLHEKTGLHSEAIVAAKCKLAQMRIIDLGAAAMKTVAT